MRDSDIPEMRPVGSLEKEEGTREVRGVSHPREEGSDQARDIGVVEECAHTEVHAHALSPPLLENAPVKKSGSCANGCKKSMA